MSEEVKDFFLFFFNVDENIKNTIQNFLRRYYV